VSWSNGERCARLRDPLSERKRNRPWSAVLQSEEASMRREWFFRSCRCSGASCFLASRCGFSAAKRPPQLCPASRSAPAISGSHGPFFRIRRGIVRERLAVISLRLSGRDRNRSPADSIETRELFRKRQGVTTARARRATGRRRELRASGSALLDIHGPHQRARATERLCFGAVRNLAPRSIRARAKSKAR
jgi:hypothetical protein